MGKYDSTEFLKWLSASKMDEHDIINCRKMQNMSFSESENTFGISTVSICGFINNDVVKLGGDIKQHYDEDKATYINRAYRIFIVAGHLMDSVNAVLEDEGSWTDGYFQNRLTEWRDRRLGEIQK